VEVIVPAAKKGNVVARLRGTGGGRPVLFLAHLDVVEARRDEWTMDPFRLNEKDGYFYGRGTQDIKGDAALLVTNFIRLKQEGFRPQRDLILALTADEENGGQGSVNGVQWFLDHRRSLIDAQFCVNTDSGGGQARQGERLLFALQAAEKAYLSVVLRATNPGGHSSMPRPENAIYDLATALMKIRELQFPVDLNEVTRAYFSRTAGLKNAPAAADRKSVSKSPPDQNAAARLSTSPYENALLRTTCVATMLSGGHAENALPQTAEATVNCRVLPGEIQASVVDRIRATVGPTIDIRTKIQMEPTIVYPLPQPLLTRVQGVVQSIWPGLPVVPVMETGGTDGEKLRRAGIPTYGVCQIFADLDDIRAHGRDERIRTEYFYEGLEFGYRLMKELSRPF
jgi:acetylornithine deacetylase/succinyl-diaminopimelate desuccinylase-like protein